ncbi:MAG: alanine--tRNA ligase [Anaerolineae bacterium]|nr:alanine--tRNA ligase [Anaerolineae bacterium]
MLSAEIRKSFLDFFAENGHTVVPSSSLVPENDPTLLFTNAGMVQFKDVFLGIEKRSYTRATSAQKCMRVSGKHNDLENVGPSPRHHTFFEMLGNFSFGDYFKKEAIAYAWEFLTRKLGLPEKRLWATIYEEDDEAWELWQKVAGMPPEKIVRMGKKDNFWAMGDTGPCGPCSEIIYDRGEKYCTCHRPDCSPAVECERWWELWNLVFMQYELHPDGTMTPLPRPSIDTGMGLERITAVMQGVESNYETDLFWPIILKTRDLIGHSDEQVLKNIVSYRVIADHGRAITFLVGDGVTPSNEGRGYILRMILRRAARHGRKIGFREPFLAHIADKVIEIMGHHYTELIMRREFIKNLITQEEERFQQTLDVGLNLLDELMEKLTSRGLKVIPGEEAFYLYDTYGFPLDLTRVVARERGFEVDEEGFNRAMEAQRARARAARTFEMEEEELKKAEFYSNLYEQLKREKALPEEGVEHLYETHLEVRTRVVAIVKGGERVSVAHKGDEVEVILPQTPFYVESGGQVSDTGWITCTRSIDGEETVWEMEVEEMLRPITGLIIHKGKITEGTARVGDEVWATVDAERRMDISRNHTATHILHSQLRRLLGRHVYQTGSLVAPDRLRFDFTHTGMLTQTQISDLERMVNDVILANYPVQIVHTTYKEAIAQGAIALFEEKYGEEVRMLMIGHPDEIISKELCGGTHVSTTGEIGFFHILSEQGVGTGVRRIEAVTGRYAQELVMERLRVLESTAAFLSCLPEEVDRRVLALMGELQNKEREIQKLQRALARKVYESLLDKAIKVKDVSVVAARIDEVENEDILREMSDWLREALGSAVVTLATIINGKPFFIAAITEDLVSRGLHAGNLIKEVAKVVGGGGGGKATMAQAGGRDKSRIEEALRLVPDLVASALKD